MLFVVGIVFVVTLLSVTLRHLPILKAEKFIGVITGEQISCILSDDGMSIVVDGKKLIIEPRYGASLVGHGVGSIDSRLLICDDFDYRNIRHTSRGVLSMPAPNQPDGGEGLIGAKVEVYAQKIASNEYTLEGSEQFYIKLIGEALAQPSEN